MYSALVALIGIPFDQLKLVLVVAELDQLEDLAQVGERDEPTLLAEDVKDAHEVEALVLDVAVDPAQ